MILEIKTVKVDRTSPRAKKEKKVIIYECDQCKVVFEGKYQKKFLTNRKFHLCSYECLGKSRSADGVALEYQLESRDMKKWHSNMTNTVKKRYGVENVSSLDWVKNKKVDTSMRNFGVSNPLKCKEVKEKSRQTCISRFGVTSPQKHPKIQEKTRKTCLERYGAENVSKSEYFSNLEYNDKRHKSGYARFRNREIWFRSSYEEKFIKHLDLDQLVVDVKCNIPVKYEFEGKEHTYFIDFGVEFSDGKKVLFEVKNAYSSSAPVNIEKFKAAKSSLNSLGYDDFKVITEKELYLIERVE